MTAIPNIIALPAPPQRGQEASVFAQKADAFIDALFQFAPQLNQFAQALRDEFYNLSVVRFTATSTSAVAIGTGAKAFTITQGVAFIPGQAVMIASAADSTKYMQGLITSYDGATGALSVMVTAIGGDGARNDWRIGLVPAFDIEQRLAQLVAPINAQFAALGTMSTRNKATAAELFAWIVDKGVTADAVGNAFAPTALAYAATLAWDWRDGFYRGPVVCTGNVTIGTPTNIRPGETRILTLQGNDASARTVSFSSAYKGPLPSIADMTSTKPYRFVVFADSATNLTIDARALG